jgi:N-acetylmuramoyl-L-alanine amidase
MNKKYTGIDFPLWLLLVLSCSWIAQSVVAQENESYRLKTVVIDAGHGGKDPGSPGKIANEKDVVLAIALKLGKYIETQLPGVKVIYTRKTDEFIPLHQRAEIANTHKADLFISIHANGNENSEVTGTESLVLGLHRAGENFEVAVKENSVILLEDDYTTTYEGFDPNSPESLQMFSLMQERYLDRSIHFAGLVQEQFRERAQRKDRGVKQQGLLVLARTSMPGILIETGFITNPEEEKYLVTEEGQDYIASAIFRAFKSYKNLIESRSSYAIASKNGNAVSSSDSMVKALQDTPPEKESRDSGTLPEVAAAPVVLFKVQITASSKPVTPGSHVFKGLTGISEYKSGNLYKYAVGNSRTFEEILAYSKQVKEKFPDAFVIAVKDNKIIPLDQALKESQQFVQKK